MNQLIVVFLSGAVLLGLVAWGQRPEHHVPTWLYLLAAAPLAWVQIFGSDRKNEGSVQKGLAILYLFGASIFLMVIGFVGWVMRGTWAGIMAPALPFGAAIFALALIVAFFRR